MNTAHVLNLLDFYEALRAARTEEHGLSLLEMAAAIADIFDEAEVSVLAEELYAQLYPELSREEITR